LAAGSTPYTSSSSWIHSCTRHLTTLHGRICSSECRRRCATLVQVSPETTVPLDYRYLVENFVALVPSATAAGGRHATEADGVYLVESSPRRYVVVVFADKPSDVARFCFLVAAQPHCTVHFRYIITVQCIESTYVQK